MSKVTPIEFYEAIASNIPSTVSRVVTRMLNGETDIKECLEYCHEEGFEVIPAFIAATRKGNIAIVKQLIQSFYPEFLNLEQTCRVFFEQFEIHGATALWCASGEGHLEIVKLLVEAGAQVNHATESHSIPLRTAAFSGHTEVVRYLLQHGADLNKTNRYKNTSLMVSAYQGHLPVVQLLLENGADPDLKDVYGSTCLHEAAQNGHLEVVKLISKYSVKHVRDKNCVTPSVIQSAADNNHVYVVEHMAEADDIYHLNDLEKAEAFELLGASYANTDDNYSLDYALHYMLRGMDFRYTKDDILIYPKPEVDVMDVYENRKEAANKDDLVRRGNNPDDLHYEALLVRERILGRDSELLPSDLIFRGDVFADEGRYDRCLALWLYALEITFDQYRSITRDLLAFIQIFCEMKMKEIPVSFDLTDKVLDYYEEELKRDLKRKDDAQHIDMIDEPPAAVVYARNIVNMVNLISFVSKMDLDKEQDFRLRKHVFSMVNMPAVNSARLPLHVCLDPDIKIDEMKISFIVEYPDYDVMRLFLECGHDVNKRSTRDNNACALHLVAQNAQLEDEHVFDMLRKFDCHWHLRDDAGDFPSDILSRKNMTALVPLADPYKGASLRCLATLAIKDYGLNYEGQLPKSLENFVNSH